MSTRKERESDICRSIKTLIDNSDRQVSMIKNRWRENYDMFVEGSKNDDKEDWQTQFSVNKLETSIRTAQGRLVSTLVNTPDWYELCPAGYNNQQAEVLAPAFQKMMDYYMDAGRFKRHASTFFLCALISSGCMHIGWKYRLIQNPEYLIDKTKKEFEKEQRRLAKNVANPQVEPDMSGEDLQENLIKALEEFTAEAQGLPYQEEKIAPYLQIGCLDILDINHEKQYWDPNVQYMEDSIWRAVKWTCSKDELKMAAKLGYLPKNKIKQIGGQKALEVRLATSSLRYGNIIQSGNSNSDTVELTLYYGPLIIDGEIEKDKYFALLANDNVLLKDGEYPFWEPPGHHTPVLTAAVKQIPYRATGAGIGDSAVELQKLYDSNWQLVCDTFRFGISGINIVNYQNLVDKGQLDEGLYPGMTLQVRGVPKDSFEHISLTDNIENQAHPVQSMLENAIDNLTGINELMVGGGNEHSRTPAAETNARLGAGQQNVNTIALDLEQQFLIPALQKIFARVLQFGLPELNSNPELQALFTEEELTLLNQLSAQSRLEIMNQWYKFKVKGFSEQSDKDAAAQRDNELLQIINSGGPLSSLINLPEFMKQYFRNRDIKDPNKLIMTDSPIVQITAENQTLMSGHMVIPAPEDDHELHLQMHSALAQSPYATPEIQQHAQIHEQYLQQMQMQQAQGQQEPPIQ